MLKVCNRHLPSKISVPDQKEIPGISSNGPVFPCCLFEVPGSICIVVECFPGWSHRPCGSSCHIRYEYVQTLSWPVQQERHRYAEAANIAGCRCPSSQS